MRTLLFVLVASILLLECHTSFNQLKSPIHTRGTSKLKSDQGFRLPQTARPVFYDVTLNLNLGGPEPSASGEVTITVNVDESNDENILYLNSEVSFAPDATANWMNEIDVFPCAINDTQPGYIAVNCTKSIRGNGQMVSMNFTPAISLDSMRGIYAARFYEEDRQKYIIATQFEQDSARAAFPCFDEPEFKAPITLTLVTQTGGTYSKDEMVANTDILESTDYNGNTVTSFWPTPTMSTYLLAFIVTEDFKTFPTTDTENKTYDFSVFARKTADGFVGTALKYGPELIDTMGAFLNNIPYDSLGNTKITLAAIPEFAAGAMENWGLITFRETLLIDEGNETSRRDMQSIISVIAHELAHQWFGDYVTLDWWSDTWLNEGFAQFFEYYLTDQVLDDAEMMLQLVIKEQQPALKVDAYPDSIPLSNNASNVTTKSDFTEEFGTISYSKGASLVRLLNYTLDQNFFQKALNTYLTEHAFGNASAADLLDTIAEARSPSIQNLTQFLNEWIYEAGYPVLEVSLNTTNSSNVNIQSKRFSSALNKSEDKNDANWWIPLTYTTSVKPDFDVRRDYIEWLSPEKIQNHSIPIGNDSWVIVNLQSIGFFRVNYDDALWRRLIVALKSDSFGSIEVVNRAQLLDDVFNIARSYEGTVDEHRDYYLRAFNVTEYLVNETEYHPWYTFFAEIQYLLDRIQDEDTLDTLKEYVKNLVSNQADEAIARTTDSSQTHIQVLRDNLLLNWACKLGHEKCVSWAQKLFQSYADGNKIDNNYRDVIVCTGLATSKNLTKDYAFVMEKLNSSILPLEQNDLAKVLGCVNNANFTYQAIQETLKENRFSRMMYPTILSSLISDGTTKLIYTLKSVLDKDLQINQTWQAIGSTEGILGTIAAKCFSVDCIETINDYINIHENDTARASIVTAAKKFIVTIQTNLEWVDKYGDVLTSVIVYGGNDIPTTTTTSAPETTTAGGKRIIAFSMFFSSTVALLVSMFKLI